MGDPDPPTIAGADAYGVITCRGNGAYWGAWACTGIWATDIVLYLPSVNIKIDAKDSAFNAWLGVSRAYPP